MSSRGRRHHPRSTDMLLESDDQIRGLLQNPGRIAMVGASTNPARDAYRVFAYLQNHGFDVLPVTPKPDPVHGSTPVPDLQAAAGLGPIGIVDVFRNRDAAPAVTQEAIAAGAKAIWYQFGTDHPDAVAAALAAGLDVVADKCIKVEHARLL